MHIKELWNGHHFYRSVPPEEEVEVPSRFFHLLNDRAGVDFQYGLYNWERCDAKVMLCFGNLI